jgi:ribosomal protein S18 acetylase RimI-like enzyme
MIRAFRLEDESLARRALEIQRLAYRIEADLIGFEGIPPLHESLEQLRASPETFLGYFVDEELSAFVSYELADSVLDIGRLVVHPDYFRRGIGQTLIRALDETAGIKTIIVSTGALNLPARKLYENLGFSFIDEMLLDAGVKIARYEKHL